MSADESNVEAGASFTLRPESEIAIPPLPPLRNDVKVGVKIDKGYDLRYGPGNGNRLRLGWEAFLMFGASAGVYC
jgi:hypothetical protein